MRLLGLDAPEVPHPGTSSEGSAMETGECFGVQATQMLRDLTPAGSTVMLFGDSHQPDRDAYGRLLRYVMTPGHSDVGSVLILRGAALQTVWDAREADQAAHYLTAGLQARKNGAGLWGSCSDPSPSAIR